MVPNTYHKAKVLKLLFVYGTLRSRFNNRHARLLRSQADLAGTATVPGSIYRVRHFPAFRPEPAGEVHGELYRLRDPETTLHALDEYEGAEFERVVVEGAWIYQYRNQPPTHSRIASGDFCEP
jgi:gamma-glutamylcyclotransferase (GGCT)/AIG2-like uncharacterized protein YtfP